MREKQNTGKILPICIIGAVVVLLLVAGIGMMRGFKKNPELVTKDSQHFENIADQTSYGQNTATGAIEKNTKIDFQSLETNKDLEKLMTKRKQNLGVTDSLDMIVQEDEQFTVGDKKASMPDILKKIHTQKGEVYEENISGAEQVTAQKSRQYGIYVVRPKDNIWNIHFRLLKDYFASKNIPLSPSADEPETDGTSSGIGKILKFSENLVAIYHLEEKKLVENINIIEPLTKVVIYNMAEIFSLLEEIDYQNVNRIEFDGTNIWIPPTNTQNQKPANQNKPL